MFAPCCNSSNAAAAGADCVRTRSRPENYSYVHICLLLVFRQARPLAASRTNNACAKWNEVLYSIISISILPILCQTMTWSGGCLCALRVIPFPPASNRKSNTDDDDDESSCSLALHMCTQIVHISLQAPVRSDLYIMYKGTGQS